MLTTHDTRADFADRPCTTAVLPVGAVEQHGAHLPVGTDWMLAQALAQPLAEKLNAYLLPPLAVSASMEHRKAKGTVYLRAETLALVVRDMADSLRGSGFARLVLVNFHGGNWILKPTIRQINRDLAPFRVVLLTPDLPAAAAAEILQHPAGDIHGGEYETSLMLHLYPTEVRQVPLGGDRHFPAQPLLDYFDSTELAPEGFWGWPETATAEKGRLAFAALIAASLDFLQQLESMDRKLSNQRESGIRIRTLQESDITRANELRSLARWNQSEDDWRGYVRYEPDGCFAAELNGQTVGTATTIRYGEIVGWIGMVLVHPDQRRMGVGSQLLRQAISYLKGSGVRCIKLDATPMGRKVYVPLGFVDEYELARYEITAPTVDARAANAVAPFTPAAIDFVARFDAPIFGVERRGVIAELSARNPELCFVSSDENGIRGYLIAREGANAVQVGPWIARDAATAERLLLALFSRVGGRTVFVDLLGPNVDGTALMKKHAFRVQRTLTRMYLGENTAPGEPQFIYSISGAEKG